MDVLTPLNATDFDTCLYSKEMRITLSRGTGWGGGGGSPPNDQCPKLLGLSPDHSLGHKTIFQ